MYFFFSNLNFSPIDQAQGKIKDVLLIAGSVVALLSGIWATVKIMQAGDAKAKGDPGAYEEIEKALFICSGFLIVGALFAIFGLNKGTSASVSGETIKVLARATYAAMMPIAGLICVAGYVMRQRDAEQRQQRILILTSLVVVCFCISQFFPIVVNSVKAMSEMTDSIRESSDNFYKSIDDYEKSLEDESPSILTDSDGFVSFWSVKIGSYLTVFGKNIVIWFQDVSIMVLWAFCPLLISFFMIPHTQASAVKFGMTTFQVICWTLGFIMADMIMAAGGGTIASILGVQGAVGASSSIIATAVTGATAIPVGLALSAAVGGFFLAIAFGLNLLYALTPLGIAALFSGANPVTTQAGASAFMGMQAAGVGGRLGAAAARPAGALAEKAMNTAPGQALKGAGASIGNALRSNLPKMSNPFEGASDSMAQGISKAGSTLSGGRSSQTGSGGFTMRPISSTSGQIHPDVGLYNQKHIEKIKARSKKRAHEMT